MNQQIPRPEYPRPGFRRESWRNLNGAWEFYIDAGASGVDREVYKADKFDGEIVVPFCPESKLSGVGKLDFMPSVWYARAIELTEAEVSGRVLLHIGACDYLTTVYVNGAAVGTHEGGYTSFTFDLTDFAVPGTNRLVVHAADEARGGTQPCGKQSRKYYSHACDYTRTTGIWQTVWLEFVPAAYMQKIKVTATDPGGEVRLETTLNRYVPDASLRVQAFFEDKPAADKTFPLNGVTSAQTFTVSPVKLWNAGEPNLYDVVYTLLIDGKPVDRADGYFGIRRIDIDGVKVRINGRSVFQRLILDQGFYPDGIYTAPSDAALVRDIELSMAAGFNGARLHQKVFEERFLYHADHMGYLVWGEYGSWGLDHTRPEALHAFLPQWLESVERDYNHPAIIGWCPYNETWDLHGYKQYDPNLSVVYLATKAVDPTRPVIDTSGNYHTAVTDIYDVHDYEHDPKLLAERYGREAKKIYTTYPERQQYDGKRPFFISECGGIKWTGTESADDRRVSWGYGEGPETEEEFCERYCALAEVLLDAPGIMGLCYTQLTDVEQEQNGLYYYDRSPKFPPEQYAKMRAAMVKKAAIEEE